MPKAPGVVALLVIALPRDARRSRHRTARHGAGRM